MTWYTFLPGRAALGWGRLSDRARFESEAIPHMRELYATACRLTASRREAEDMVQETFLRAFRTFHTVDAGTPTRPWLYAILHRVRADGFPRVAGPAVPGVHHGREQLAPGAAPDENESVRRALAQVPDPYRTAVLLRDVQDFSYAEIATITRVPVGTVMSRIHRGRALLRRLVADRRP